MSGMILLSAFPVVVISRLFGLNAMENGNRSKRKAALSGREDSLRKDACFIADK